ncbi:MAG: trypsin-like peptidase domain-containing protein [Leptolyngbyaceae cyanobacterium SM1_3_5]|nr:trypsin-like peptidase domain-containing protein [Leptolyngbyaceae cyanobacterium SM1_3_5]
MDNKVPELRDSLSEVPFRISMCFKDIQLAIGTAFTYLYQGQLYLVTNWHNVTGREPSTLKLKSGEAAIPDRLRIEIPVMVGTATTKSLGPETICLEWRETEFLLYEDTGEYPTKPVWYEHPQHGHEIDVVVAPIGVPEGISVCPANDSKLNLSAVLLRPSLDVFILGFPRGMSGGAKFPVWKRGSIASEPEIDVDNLPKILIDTATREGMSGSPVYLCQIGYFQSEEKYDEGGYQRCLGEGRRFLGVYSGRIGDDNFQAQLGIVWKASVIEEIIQAAQVGRSSFELSCTS